MDLSENLISALLGLVSGVVASLIAPWVHLGIDARRERMKNRKDLLQAARTLLADPPPIEEFRSLPIFFQLKPHLSAGTNKTIDGEFDARGQDAEDMYKFYVPLFPQAPRVALAEGMQSIRDTFSKKYPAAQKLQESDISDSSFIDELEKSGFIQRLYAGDIKR